MEVEVTTDELLRIIGQKEVAILVLQHRLARLQQEFASVLADRDRVVAVDG